MEELVNSVNLQYLGLLTAGVLTLRAVFNWLSARSKQSRLSKAVKDFLSQRNKKISAFLSKHRDAVDPEKQALIVSLSVTDLCAKIKSREISSREAFLTYAIRTCIVGKFLNAVADLDLESGLLQAERADEIIRTAKDARDLPMLIGLPISVKENIQCKGLLSTIGFSIRVTDESFKSKDDAYLIKVLQAHGAIVLCHSTVPQGLFSFESVSNLFGSSTNPWNYTKTSGGSSGGESSLVSAYCSPMGIGSDLAGSIRCPSNFCGLYGFKPTSTRTPYTGMLTASASEISAWSEIQGSYGPMCRYLEDVVTYCRLTFGNFPLEPRVDKSLFNEGKFRDRKKLKVGYCLEVSMFETSTDIKDSMAVALEHLMSKGHEAVEFDLSSYLKLFYLAYESIVNSKVFKKIQQTLNGEKEIQSYSTIVSNIGSKSISSRLRTFLLSTFKTGESRRIGFRRNVLELDSLEDYYDRIYSLKEEKLRFWKHWREAGIDCLILPVFPIGAVNKNEEFVSQMTCFYTLLLNVLDLPALSIPTGLFADTNYSTNFSDLLSKHMQSNQKSNRNMPLGFQVCAFPGEDETVLRVAAEIDEKFNFSRGKDNRRSVQENIEEVLNLFS